MAEGQNTPAASPPAAQPAGDTKRCGTCERFTPKGMGLGKCARRQPGAGGHPAIFADDLCGEYRRKAVK